MVSVAIEAPDPVGSTYSSTTNCWRQGATVVWHVWCTLVDATVLQQTAESEVPDMFEAPDNVIADATVSRQAAEKENQAFLKRQVKHLHTSLLYSEIEEDEASNLLEMPDSASAIIANPTETVIQVAGNDSSPQPAATLRVLIESAASYHQCCPVH